MLERDPLQFVLDISGEPRVWAVVVVLEDESCWTALDGFFFVDVSFRMWIPGWRDVF